MEVGNIGELKLIETIKNFPLVKNIGDDCAVLDYTANHYLLISTDMLLENIHFTVGKSNKEQFDNWKPVGIKAITANASDIAAMGGIPLYIFISLGLPSSFKAIDLKDLYSGFTEAAIPIKGGDIVSSNSVIINICIVGKVEKELIARRSGAKTGNVVALTGPLGAVASSNYRKLPKSRIKEARKLVKTKAITSMTDISDGLARSIIEIKKESKVDIKLNSESIPLAPEATIDNALNGGEDYELLFTYEENHKMPIKSFVIGEVVPIGQGTPLKTKGYTHF